MHRKTARLFAVLALAGTSASAAAQERIDLVLNFVASGDHAPYYYARKMGWYKQAGVDLAIEVGQGSGLAVQKVGLGKNPVGIADFGSALVGRGKGADVVAVMSTYANSPYGMYWLKGSGIKGPKDFVGKKYGVPPGDAGNVMWPAFARAVGIDPASVTIVNVSPLAKIQALKSGSIDFTQSFYSGHAIFTAGLGPDMQYLRWKDVGINPYSNGLIVNGEFLRAKAAVAKVFVQVTQRAFAACASNPEPCLQAVVAENSGLKIENERETWRLTMELMDDANAREIALGWFDAKRVASDYELVNRYFKFDKAFPPTASFSNDLLDKSIRLPTR